MAVVAWTLRPYDVKSVFVLGVVIAAIISLGVVVESAALLSVLNTRRAPSITLTLCTQAYDICYSIVCVCVSV